jgi:hypothetical protein
MKCMSMKDKEKLKRSRENLRCMSVRNRKCMNLRSEIEIEKAKSRAKRNEWDDVEAGIYRTRAVNLRMPEFGEDNLGMEAYCRIFEKCPSNQTHRHTFERLLSLCSSQSQTRLDSLTGDFLQLSQLLRAEFLMTG